MPRGACLCALISCLPVMVTPAIAATPKTAKTTKTLTAPAAVARAIAAGYAALRDGRWDTAKKEFEKVLALAPRDAAAILGLGRALLGPSSGRSSSRVLMISEGLRLFETYLELRPGDAAVREDLANVYSNRREFSRAIPHLELLVRKARGESSLSLDRLLGSLADVLKGDGDYRAAVGLYAELVRRRPLSLEAQKGLATSALRLGAELRAHGDESAARELFDRAISAFDAALTLEPPRRWEMLYELALSHAAKRDWARAAHTMTAAVGARGAPDVEKRTMYNRLGDFYYQMEDWVRAEEAWREHLRLVEKAELPAHVAKNNLAWLLCRAKDPAVLRPREALDLALEAVWGTEWKHAGHLDTLAEAYYVLGRYEEALETIDLALALPMERDDEHWFRVQRRKYMGASEREVPSGRMTSGPWWTHEPGGR